jgi:hypothetical protein
MAAISAALMATLKSGDHAVMPCAPPPPSRSPQAGSHPAARRLALTPQPAGWRAPTPRGAFNGLLTRLPVPARVADAVYGGTNEFMSQFLQHWGIEWTLVDATDPNEFAKALRPNTKVVYTESPANPTCRLTDLAAVGALVTEWAERTGNKKPWVMCDATFATPFHQRSLEIPGVDVAIHSATKYATHPLPRHTHTPSATPHTHTLCHATHTHPLPRHTPTPSATPHTHTLCHATHTHPLPRHTPLHHATHPFIRGPHQPLPACHAHAMPW